VAGTRSGSAPWAFVSLAIDASASVNNQRELQGLSNLDLKFKFADAFERTRR
jgi:hypothetical protein